MIVSDIRKFPRGSEWRRWDLHIHSPESVLNNQFGNSPDSWDIYVHSLFTKAISKNIAAIGITDYLSIDGYRKLKREYMDDGERLAKIFTKEIKNDADFLDKVHNILIIPNIEFRLQKYVEHKKDGAHSRLTLHLLFSDTVSIDDIEENFLKRLEISYFGISQGRDEKLPLSRANMEKLGRRLREEHEPFRAHSSELYTGCMQVAVDDDQISSILTTTPTLFKNKYLIVLAEEHLGDVSWDGAGHHPRKMLYQKSDMIFSSNRKTIDWALSKRTAEEFGGMRPCIWGSDAHSLKTLFEPDLERFCWIKADVTFNGLRQVTNEPIERCYIGECPPALLALRDHTKPHIASLGFTKIPNSTLEEKWFDGLNLTFNPGMVAIIGNKGGGKSALADTLALLGSPGVSQKHFSFLRSERFRKRDSSSMKMNRAEQFVANIEWSTNEQANRLLSHQTDSEELERVRYLPQGYLEKLCNEHDEEPQAEFRRELNRVIFSHVSPAARLGKTTLEDLIDYRADEVIRSKSSLKRHLRDINHKIFVIEQKLTASAFAAWDEKVKLKERELLLHDQNKPTEILVPAIEQGSSPKANQQIKRLDEIKKGIESLLEQKAIGELTIANLFLQREKINKIVDRLNKFEQWFASLSADVKTGLLELGVDSEGVLEAHVRRQPVEKFITELNEKITKHEQLLSNENQQGYFKRMYTLEMERNTLQSVLDAPNQKYQRYLAELRNWERRRKEILGSKDSPETLEYYKNQIEEIMVSLPMQLESYRNDRRSVASKIYQELVNQANVYRECYRPVLDFIGNQRGNSDQSTFKVSFDVIITRTNFVEQFFDIVNQGVSGSFCGVAEGRKRLLDMMPDGVFDDGVSALNFVEEVIHALSEDLRGPGKKGSSHLIEKQLRKTRTVEEVYNLLYSFEYLEPKYALRFGDKGLQELSPGERGLLLLVFYLLIDKDDSPLIIDQPEENLDNQSVKDILVPCIKAAKERRQLFIVTHNPNIAVVCDAEQVIFSSINKTDGYVVNYDSGSLEDGVISRHIVNVLEGTPPAFENRSQKYRTGGSI